ncbi:MAG: hypothetical protein ACTSU6_01175 [Candidatus Njordarchaeales archaeon]
MSQSDRHRLVQEMFDIVDSATKEASQDDNEISDNSNAVNDIRKKLAIKKLEQQMIEHLKSLGIDMDKLK